MRINQKMGIDDLYYIIFTTFFSDTVSLAFSLLPTITLFAKITPHHIEATVFAMLTGAYNLSNNVLSPLFGSLFTRQLGVDSEHLDKYPSLIMIQIFFICFTFLYIMLLPTRKEIDNLQMHEIIEEEKENEEIHQH